MRNTTIPTILLCLAGLMAAGYHVDAGLFRKDDCKPNILRPDRPFPIDELASVVEEELLPVIDPPQDDMEQRLAQLERAIETAGITVIFEGGDDSGEEPRTVRVPLGGKLTIPPQVIRIRTVDKHGHVIAPPVTDVAPLGVPLKVRNVVR